MNNYLTNFIETERATGIDEVEQNLNELAEKSKMESDSNIIGKNLDINHIDFSPRTYCDKRNINKSRIKQQYLQKIIIPELDLQGKQFSETLLLLFENKRQMLKNLLLDEKYKKIIINVVKRSKSTRDAVLIIMEQAIPCCLHINMRITEKFVKILL